MAQHPSCPSDTRRYGAGYPCSQVTGIKPNGFRGPGYSLSISTLRVLVRRGYRYDASTFPTYLGPLARAYYYRRYFEVVPMGRHVEAIESGGGVALRDPDFRDDR